MSDDKVRCVLNNCERPQGIGMWCYVRGMGVPQPVCEDHWQALGLVARNQYAAQTPVGGGHG